MPDRQVTISVSLLGLQDASTAARGFAGDVKDVGTAAAEATAQAAPLGPAVDKTTAAASAAAPALKEVGASIAGLTDALKGQIGPAADAAGAAIDRLGNVQGMRGLALGIAQAQVKMDAFKTSIAQAEAAGQKMPPSVTAALQGMQGTIDASTQRLGTLKAGMSEVSTKAMAMGESWKQASASGGSLNSMMFNLAETSGGATAALAKTGLAGIGIFEAFKVGLVIGKEFDAGMKTIGLDLSRLAEPANLASNVVAGLSTQLAKSGIGGAEFTKWAKEATAAMNAYGDVMDPVVLKVNTLMKVHQAAAQQLGADEAALKKIGVAWQDVGRETATTAQEIKLVDDALHRASLAGQDQITTITLNSKALQGLRQKLEDEGISLDSLSPRLKTAILLSQGLTDAHTKHATVLKLVRESNEQVIPAMDKLLNSLQQEDQAALKSKTSITDVANAHEKAVLALVQYGKENGLTAEQVAKLIKAQSGMLDVTKAATDEGIDRMNIALSKYGVNLEDVSKKTETLVEQQKRLNDELKASSDAWDKQTAFIKARNAAIDASTVSTNAWGAAINGTTAGLITNTAQAAAWGASLTNMSTITAQATIALSGLDDKLKQAASAALAATDAFGTLAAKFGQVTGAVDKTSVGLKGVMWDMVHATSATASLTAEQSALIESLARVSDAFGPTNLWVGHLLSQLKAGTLSLADFRQEAGATINAIGSLGFKVGGELSLLDEIIAKFLKTSKDGWPVTVSTRPYANSQGTDPYGRPIGSNP